jgi:hypothetical protein
MEFAVFGTPISSQGSSKSKSAWKSEVKQASYSALPEGHFWHEGEVSVTIYYFPSAPMIGDIDNLIKMTIDALVGHILKDDRQVARVVIQRFEPDSVFAFANPTEVLTQCLASEDSSVYIRISTDVHEEL